MTNYSRGRAFEYDSMEFLESKGYRVLRSAGSHGPIDIIASKRLDSKQLSDNFNANPRVIHKTLAVQCKVGRRKARFEPLEADNLIEWANEFGAHPLLFTRDKLGTTRFYVRKTGLESRPEGWF